MDKVWDMMKRVVQDVTPRCFASSSKWMELPFAERKKKTVEERFGRGKWGFGTRHVKSDIFIGNQMKTLSRRLIIGLWGSAETPCCLQTGEGHW